MLSSYLLAIPEIYMHQFWNSIKKIGDSDVYNFRLEKKKCRVDIEVFHEILQICPRLHNQMHQPWRTFATIINRCISGKTTGLDRLMESRAQILWGIYNKKNVDYYGALIPDDMINQDIKDSKAYKTYYDFATGKATPKKGRKYKKVASPSRKLSPVLEEEPVVKPKKAKKPAKKSTTVPTTGVVIKDTPGVSISKKKAPGKVDRGKGMDLLTDAALLEVAQVKEALKKSKKDSYMLHPSGLGDGVGSQPKVPNESKDKTTGTDEGTDSDDDDDNDDDSDDISKGDDDKADSDDDNGNDAQNSERTDSDEEENRNLNLKVDEEEETLKDEYIHTHDYYVPTDEETNDEKKEFNDEEYDELYKDVNVRSKVAEHEEVGKGDAEMTDATHESSKQSSSVSSDFASKFLKLDNVPPVIDEVAYMMNVNVRYEESSTQAPPILLVPVTAIPETSTVPSTTVPPSIQPFTPIPQ
ncbi:hypothetical protein Tco_0670014 [Tanacetum coccineum]